MYESALIGMILLLAVFFSLMLVSTAEEMRFWNNIQNGLQRLLETQTEPDDFSIEMLFYARFQVWFARITRDSNYIAGGATLLAWCVNTTPRNELYPLIAFSFFFFGSNLLFLGLTMRAHRKKRDKLERVVTSLLENSAY